MATNDLKFIDEKKIEDNVAKEYKTYFIVMIILTILVLGFLGFFIYDYVTDRNEKVPVANCNKPGGEFAVEPETNHATGCTLQVCKDRGGDSGDACVFSVSGLNDAIKTCNQNPDICNRFTYFPNSKSMSITSLNCDTSVKDPATMSFLRQVNITFADPGDNTPQDNSVRPITSSFNSFVNNVSTTIGSGVQSVQSNSVY